MRCVENTYVVSWCRRGEWYIWCASVTSLPGAQQACLILRTGIRKTFVVIGYVPPFVLVIVRERNVQVK